YFFKLRQFFGKKIGSRKEFCSDPDFFLSPFFPDHRPGHVCAELYFSVCTLVHFDFAQCLFGQDFLVCRKSSPHHTLISTSTPLGSSSFIRASMVFDEEL